MSKLTKGQVIGIIISLVIIVIGGIFYLAGQQKKEGVLAPGGEEEAPAALEGEERLSLAGQITNIVSEENYIVVKPSGEETEVKVVLAETTEIIQLKFPFEPGEAPTEGTFTPERLSITIAELEIGKSVLIETAANLVGKTEISDVTRVQVLP